jgi:hypothetical protein
MTRNLSVLGEILMVWLTQLLNFTDSLAAHWIALLTGGAGVLALGLWERKRRRAIRFPQYVAFAIAAIIPAAYLSWSDEYQLREKAETQIALYNNAQTQRQRFIEEHLSQFYVEAQALLNERITPDEFPNWAGREGEFGRRAASWIQENMGNTAMMKFQDMNGPSYDFAGLTVAPRHTGALNWLNKASANLQVLMHNPAWDGHAPQMPPPRSWSDSRGSHSALSGKSLPLTSPQLAAKARGSLSV